MLRTIVFAVIMTGYATFRGHQWDTAPGPAGPVVAEIQRPATRPSRPRRTPPAPTVCRETAIPEPAPTCGP